MVFRELIADHLSTIHHKSVWNGRYWTDRNYFEFDTDTDEENDSSLTTMTVDACIDDETHTCEWTCPICQQKILN